MVTIPFGIRCRVAIVRGVAKLLGIPCETHEHCMRAVIRLKILDYIDEACWVMEHVFEQDERTVERFDEWAYDSMMHIWDNPYVMHEYPFELAADYLGYASHGHFEPDNYAERERYYILFRQKSDADPEFQERFRKSRWGTIDQTVSLEPLSNQIKT